MTLVCALISKAGYIVRGKITQKFLPLMPAIVLARMSGLSICKLVLPVLNLLWPNWQL
jgi:hypothetical protein